MLILKNINIVS